MVRRFRQLLTSISFCRCGVSWCGCGFAVRLSSRPQISHAIPLRVLQLLKSERWNSAVFEALTRSVVRELHAELVNVGTVAGHRMRAAGHLAAVGLVADGVLHPIGKIQPLLIGWNVPDPVEPLRAYCVVSAAATPCARS